MWQLKLVSTQVFSKSVATDLISKEIILSLRQEVAGIFDGWEENLKQSLRKFLSGEDFVKDVDVVRLKKLSAYVTYYDFPYKLSFCKGDILDSFVKMQSSNLSTETVKKMLKSCDVHC